MTFFGPNDSLYSYTAIQFPARSDCANVFLGRSGRPFLPRVSISSVRSSTRTSISNTSKKGLFASPTSSPLGRWRGKPCRDTTLCSCQLYTLSLRFTCLWICVPCLHYVPLRSCYLISSHSCPLSDPQLS